MAARNNDPVEVYLDEVAKAQPLSADEENTLFEQVRRREDPERAKRTLIESKLASVVDIARRYSSFRLPIIELIQEGNCGLMKAVDTFAETGTGDFTTHASALIDAAVRQAIAERDSNERSSA
jgi:RNA polymerase primary sigma factor